MISIQLLFFLVFIYVIFTCVIFYLVLNKHLSVRDSLPWFLFLLLMIIITFSKKLLFELSSLLGIEVISNMIFFFGFVLLISICLFLSVYLSKQKKEITVLVQEVGILKKTVEESKNEKKNKKI